jgi:CRISPR-associated protein Cas5h
MKSNKVLVFELSADYGQLKKYYTTMSPLSFSIPPGTVIRGILGAIIGIDKEKNPEYFHNVRLALSVLQPVKKVTIPENLIKTGKSNKRFSRYEQHKPTIIEFVKDARFRIYVHTDNEEIYNALKTHLFNHTSVYNISLGISEALANFDNVQEVAIGESLTGKSMVHSIIPVDQIAKDNIDFEEVEVFTTKLPMKMMNDREVIEYREFLFERRGLPVQAEVEDLVELSNGDHVVFF